MTELIDDVVDDAVVGGRGGAQHGHAARQQIEDARDPAVVGAEVVTPVADAMRLVDHEQPDALGEVGEHGVAELRVGEAFGGDEQEIDAIGIERRHDLVPLGGVVARDARRLHATALARLDLVAHQAEQGRDEQGRARAAVAQHAGRDEVDRALAPARALHDEDPALFGHQRLDRLELVGPELRRRPDERPQHLVRLVVQVAHVRSLPRG